MARVRKPSTVNAEQRSFFERRWLVLLILVATALVPRVIMLSSVAGDEFFADPVMDTQVYDDWSWTIVSGEYHGQAELYLSGSYYMGPLYAYFLVAVYSVFGHSVLAACILGVLIGVGTVLLVHGAARRLYGPKVGFFAGLVAALYPALFFYDAALLMSNLLVFLTALMLYLIVAGQQGDRWYHWLGAGLCIGLYALGRANILLFAPVLALWVFFAWWKKPAGMSFRERLRERWRPGLRRAVLLTLGVLMLVVPATIHNAVVGGEFVPVTANGGINFYIGNNELATGEYVNPSWIDVKHDPGGLSYVQGRLGERVSYGEASRWWSARAGEWITENPGRWLGLTATKALYFAHRHEIMQVANIHVILGWETPSLFFGVLFSLALAAFVWDRERRRRMGAWWLFALVYAFSIIVFFVTARYRLPFVVAAIPPAVWGVGELVRRLRAGGKSLVKALALLVPLLVVTNLPLDWLGFELVGNEAALANNRGTIYLESGNLGLAADEFERGIRANPKLYPLYTNLGIVELRRGYLTRAEANFERALSLYPDPKAMINLGGLLLEQGRDGDPARLVEARPYLERAVELVPGNPRAANNLAVLHLVQGEYTRAAEVLESGLRYNPEDQQLLFALGHLYATELDRPDEAVALLERFLETRPWSNLHNVALRKLEELG